jgi:gamma-D-glutamyl-L-lysine dipeptidyl-peptidase
MSKKKVKKVDQRLWMHAVCHLSVVPVRAKPYDDDQLLTQMLFGELGHIIEKKNKHWFKINTLDEIIGWVRSTQITLIEEKTFVKLMANSSVALEIAYPIFHEDMSRMIVIGSFLPQYDGMSLDMPEGKLIYNGLAKSRDTEIKFDTFVKIIRRYIYAPELKGGKSPFGIDAGAFVQIAYRCLNIFLPRYPFEQSQYGDNVIDFLDVAKMGDLIFCTDEETTINHVGIYLGEKSIIHVSGSARVDKIDHHGIFNTSLGKYTHKLRIIKRILADEFIDAETSLP